MSDSKTGCKFWWPNYVYGEVVSFRWNGPCASGLANGHGSFELVTLKAPDGKTYTGIWDNGFITVDGREINGSDPNLIRKACRK